MKQRVSTKNVSNPVLLLFSVLSSKRMIKRKRRQHTSTTTQDGNDGEEQPLRPDRDTTSGNRQTAYRSPTYIISAILLCGLLGLSVSKMSKLSLLRCITLLPVGLSLYVGVVRRRQLGQPVFRSILPLTLPLTVACSQVPIFIASAIAAAAVLSFSFITLPHQNLSSIMTKDSSSSLREASSPLPVMIAAFLLVIVMLTENFMIWVVSATFAAGQTTATAPPPLQDNGQRILLYLLNGLSRRQVISLRRMWNVQWSLVSGLGASFVVTDVFLHPKRQLYSLGTRAILTLAAARFCRTISFCLTVLPSQHPNCYQQHYPYPPPTDRNEWVWIGLLPASHGGCNDLIISGHATVTSTLACVVASVADDAWFSAAVWTMIALDYLVEIYEGFHYSVDMWLGFVTVTLLWRALKPWESGILSSHRQQEQQQPADDSTSSRKDDEAAVTMIRISKPTVHQAVLYSFPCFLAYLQLVVFPKWSANFLIIGYVLFVSGIFARFVWKQPQSHIRALAQHFAQHTVLCLLYMALGVYL